MHEWNSVMILQHQLMFKCLESGEAIKKVIIVIVGELPGRSRLVFSR